MDCMRRFSASRCVQIFVSIIRWVPVAFICAIIGWGYYGYIFEFCGEIIKGTIQKIIYIFLFHSLIIMFVWSYFMTFISKIDTPPTSFYLPYSAREDLDKAQSEQESREILENFVRSQKIPVANRAFEGGVRFCHYCFCIKPDRSHHCSICGCCILKFDHHCPWVNTCINFRNYKYFILFLGYGFYLCSFGFFTILPFFISFWQNNRFGETKFGMINTLLLFFVSGMFALSLGGLFIYHLYLIAKNKTTIESFRPPIFCYGVDKSGYNLGTISNFQQVFGLNLLLWGIPIFTSLGSGFQYIQRLNCENDLLDDGRGTDNSRGRISFPTGTGNAQHSANGLGQSIP